MQRYIGLQKINPYLMCTLCSGYLIDATTLVECLHSFCKTCLLKYLESSYNCPKCSTEIHKTKPLEYIRSDPSLQEIVYKLVPDLFSKEEKKRERWRNQDELLSDPGPSAICDDTSEDCRVLVTLKYFRGTSRMERRKAERVLQLFPTRYLCCQPEMTVRILKKFVQYKFDISAETFEIELWRGDETLLHELTLKQLVQIYGLYRERKPLELHFSLYPKFPLEPDQDEDDDLPDVKSEEKTVDNDTQANLQPETSTKERSGTNVQGIDNPTDDQTENVGTELESKYNDSSTGISVEQEINQEVQNEENVEPDMESPENISPREEEHAESSNSSPLEPIMPRGAFEDERMDET